MAMQASGVMRTALATAIIAALAGGLWLGTRGERTGGDREPLAGTATPEGLAEPAADPVSSPVAPDPVPDATADAVPAILPSLDLLRVTPDGGTVLAGRAEPGSTVTILTGETPLAEVEADASGDFVALFDAPPTAAPRPLRLEAVGADGLPRQSGDVAILLPAAPDMPPETPPASASATRAPDRADAPAPDGTLDSPPPGADPAPPVAAAVVLTTAGAEVTPVTSAPATGPLSLAAIDYAEAGSVRLSGIGPAGASLRAYVDDGFALGGTIDATGRWSLDLADLAAGVYRLRIDQVGTDGRVTRRIETPFQRDFPALDGDRPGTITVQPGNNLWTLARIHYGAGVHYTQIHTANSELIRDPDLIYPGQILTLPDDGSAN